ncbi:MAG: hypothetical protein ACR2NJ_05490 [Acidimicrobiales bacterium]
MANANEASTAVEGEAEGVMALVQEATRGGPQRTGLAARPSAKRLDRVFGGRLGRRAGWNTRRLAWKHVELSV